MVSNSGLAQIQDGNHISVITFRKNGDAVPAPVWFVAENAKFYICTPGKSFKVRRIRNNPKVQIASCDSDGQVKAEYFDAKAQILPNDKINNIYGLFRKKYSTFRLWNSLYNITRKTEDKHIYLEISPN